MNSSAFSNTDKEIRELVKKLKTIKPTRILIESTGRLEMNFVIAAFEAKLPITVCNALHNHRFAQAIGQLAKTDKIDAFTIARFGEAVKPDPSTIKPKAARSSDVPRSANVADLATLLCFI